MSRPIQSQSARRDTYAAAVDGAWGGWSHSRTFLVAALVLVGCALGAIAGTALKFPVVGTAVLFPPYAVLAAALLLTPARIWWLLVLAAALGNFWPHLQHESITSFVVWAEVANATRALIAAGGIRLLAGPNWSFNALRGMLIFLIFAAAIGPMAGAFIGAADVIVHLRSNTFWQVWQAWMLSNTLTALTILPAIVMTMRLPTAPFPWQNTLRVVEGVVLAFAVLVVGYFSLTGPQNHGSFPAVLYAPLPLMLWAAGRFGPRLTVGAVSVIAALTIAGAFNGRGPFIAQSPDENLLQLQYSLIAIAVPLLLLSATIQEQRQTHAALVESESRYRSVIEDQTELICRFLPDGTYTFVNEAYCRHFQRSQAELLGQQFWQFVPEHCQAAGREHLKAITPDRPVAAIEHEVIGPNGEIFWHSWTDRGFFDENGRAIEFQAVGRDITAQKLAESALRDNEERLALAVNAAQLGVWDWDLTSGAATWSDQMRRMYGREGVSPDAPLESFLEMIHVDDRERVRQTIIDSIENPVPYRAEYRVVLPDGTVRWIQANGQTIFNADGKPIRRTGANRDVTEAKRSEQAVRESEDQLRMFVRHTPAAVAMFDREMKYIVYSQRWLSDYKLGEQNLVGRSHYEVFPEIPERWKQIHQRCLEGSIETFDEDPFERADGTIDWIRWDVRPWRRADGEVGGIIMFTEVVTARKRADEARRHFEQRFRGLADQVPLHIWAEDEDGRGVFVNSRYLEYTGLTSDQLLSHWPEVIHPDDAQSHRDKYRAAIAQLAEFHSQARLRRKDGEYHWFDVIGVPHFESDRFVGYVGCCIDITERKRAEEEHRILELQRQNEAVRRQSEERFRTLADTAPVLIWTSGLQNEALYFNKPWLEFTGRLLEQELGYGWIDSIHPDDRQRAADTCNAAFAKREPMTMQFRLRRHDGEYRWVLDNGIPHFNAQGEFSGYIGSCVDVTSHKLAEEELEQAAQRKDEFLAILSHELRNPLAPIGIALDVVRKQNLATDDTLGWAVGVIGRQTAQLTRLVDDLLDVSRITRGKFKLNAQPLDLREVIAQAVENSRPHIEARRHEFSLSIEDDPLPMRGDSLRLAQIISNLLNNAAKYTETGGRIRLSAHRDAGAAVITVADNGMGIPPEMIDRVFEMFAQVHSMSDRSLGGLGIGLTLVKRLIELHGGTIAARSAGRDRGSEFVVRLPLILDQTVAVEPKVGESPRNGLTESARRRRILIVDDNIDAAESLSRMLQLQEHEVEVVHDGLAAVEAAERMKPEFVLLDIGLPKLDGLEVARRIRRQRLDSPPVIVATTGFGLTDDRQRTAEAGFDYHMVKPLNPQALQDVLCHGR